MENENSNHPKATEGWAVLSAQTGTDSNPIYSVQAAVDPYTGLRHTVNPLPAGGIIIDYYLDRAAADKEAKALNRTRKQRFGYDHDAASQ